MIIQLLKESFFLCQNLDSQGIYTWFSYAKSIIDETGLDILQLQNTTSSNQVKLPKKYVKSTLKFYYENLIN
jgi:dTDP-4-dehydrorhamnose reductase